MSSVSIIRGALGTASYYRKTSFGGNGKGIFFGSQWNDYSVIIDRAQSSKGSGNYFVGEGSYLPLDIVEHCAWTGTDELALVSRVAEAGKGHSFNLGIAAAEGAETVGLIVSTARRLASAAWSVKKGRIDLAIKTLGAPPKKGRMRYQPKELTTKDVSSMWLEIQYGWRPLLQDVHAATEAYAKLTEGPRKSRFYVRQAGQVVTGDSKSWANPDDYVINFEDKISKQIIVELTESLSAARSLGLQNPASIAWELVPFSFVADWFIPIGTYLEALNTIPKLNARYLETLRVEVKQSGSGGGGFPWHDQWKGAVGNSHHIRIVRTNLGSTLAIPTPRFKALDKALSPGHVKNAIALMHQVFT